MVKFRIFVFLLLAVCVIAIGTPAAFAQTSIVCEEDYTVTAGDWLSNIADKFYGDVSAYNAILLATNLKAQSDSSYATLAGPDTIFVGDKLCIPSKTDAEQLLNSAVTVTPTSPAANLTPPAGQATTTEANPIPATSVPTKAQVQSSAGGLAVSDVTFNPYDLAKTIQGRIVPASPYDNSEPPGPVGAPAHVAFQFDGIDRLRVIPTQAYQGQWNAAGNSAIARSIAKLRLLLRDTPTNPPLPLPFLPPVPATNDLAARVRYLDFDGGSGMAFIGRWAQDPSPVLSTQTDYSFLGLTNDGKYIVSFQYPVQTSALPDDVGELTPEHLAEIQANPAAYLVETMDILNKLRNSAFGPDLSRLDALVFSIRVPSAGAALPPPVGALPTPSAVLPPPVGALPTPGAGSSGGLETPAPSNDDAANKQRLLATDWKWLGTTTPTETITVDDPSKYSIRFNNANGFGITADCNIGAGNFTVTGNAIKIKDIQATLVFCGEASLDRTFTAQLLKIAGFTFEDGDLLFTLQDNAGTMRFRK